MAAPRSAGEQEPAGVGVADTLAGPTSRAQGDVELALLDVDGVIVSVNAAWEEFGRQNGADPARIGAGISYLAVCEAAADDPCAAAVKDALLTSLRGDLPSPRRIRVPCHAPRPGGEEEHRWYDVLVATRFADDGAVTGATVTVCPVPDRWPGEEATPGGATLDIPWVAGTEQEGPWPDAGWAVLEAVPDGLLLAEAGGRIVFVNGQLEKLSGYSREELLGDVVEVLVPEASRARHAELHARYDRAPRPMGRGRDLSLHRRDGTLLPVEVALAPIQVGGRTLTTATVRDVSERRAAQNRLRASEESFRASFEQAPVGMVVARVDALGGRRVLRANEALARMLGVGLDELVGSDFDRFSHPEDLVQDHALAAELATGRHPEFLGAKRYRRSDGSTLWTEVRATLIDSPDVPGTTFLAHLTDVTARRQAEQLRERHAALSTLIADVTRAVLEGLSPEATYQMIADGAARIFDAENCTLAIRDAAGFRVVAAVGPASTQLLDGKVALRQDFVQRLVDAGRLDLPQPPPDIAPELAPLLGPGTGARFGAHRDTGGVLTAFRPRDGTPFTPAESDLLAGLAQQVALAVELGRARAAQQRLAVLEDRQRIARDLHDTVIQDVIGLGMTLSTDLNSADLGTDRQRQTRDTALIEVAEGVVSRLRTVVFPLRATPASVALADGVRAVVDASARVLRHTPALTLTGPLDAVPPDVTDQVLAVLREALSNVARHAGASTTTVDVTVRPGRLVVVVEDNGCGPPARGVRPGDGLTNLEDRATALAGTSELSRRPEGGARLTWTCALPGGAHEAGAAPVRPAPGPGPSSGG